MALDTMGFVGGKDLRQISMRLEESHLTYLQLDESLSKLQARTKLEGYIKEYLCRVPNESKYIFQATAEILHRSASSVKDFSGYRACTAWRALSQYAANLLAQPWRKEYRTLRTYSGYYTHEIEANLVGAELMFELMGYKHTGLGVLTLEGPIDPDRVASVSRDAIVAYVECQILKEIWESVSQKFTISWLEVLEFRCNSVGAPEQAIRALNFRFYEKVQSAREKNTFREYMEGAQSASNAIPTTIGYPAVCNNYNIPTMMPNACKLDGGELYAGERNSYYPISHPNPMAKRCNINPHPCLSSVNSYYPVAHASFANNAMIGLPGHVASVPTGRLIELDPPSTLYYDRPRNPHNHHHHHHQYQQQHNDMPNKTQTKIGKEFDEVDHRSCDFSHFPTDRQDYAKVEKRHLGKSGRIGQEMRDSDWAFVYKSLDNLGYSKDLGERDDVLRKNESLQEPRDCSRLQSKNCRSLVDVEHDEKYDKYIRASREERKKSTGSRDNYVEGIPAERSENRRDYPSEIGNKALRELAVSCPSADSSGGDYYDGRVKIIGSNTLPNAKIDRKSEPIGNTRKSTSVDETTTTKKRFSNDEPTTSQRRDENRWNCATCTYINSRATEICEMCGKSRRKGNEDKPLASGGKECPKCTLVNEKNASSCEVCNENLKDSPTYI